jgi:hypothetical protein
MRCIPTDAAGITLGVDTHKDIHVAVALDGLGRRLGTLSIPTTPAGYEETCGLGEGVRSSGGCRDRRHGCFAVARRRHQRLSKEISELDEQLDRLVAETAPELVALEGVGSDTAASLLIAAGDNPERLKNEAAFAHMCGAAPIPASSGKSVRHRLNRHGNRDARAEPSTSSPSAA